MKSEYDKDIYKQQLKQINEYKQQQDEKISSSGKQRKQQKKRLMFMIDCFSFQIYYMKIFNYNVCIIYINKSNINAQIKIITRKRSSISLNLISLCTFHLRTRFFRQTTNKPQKKYFTKINIKKEIQQKETYKYKWIKLLNYSKSEHTKSKINFLKDVYTINHNTEWANLTNVSRLEKKFNLRIQTEFVEQKPLTLLNQKLQLNGGIVQHRANTQLNNSPKLGKNLSKNTIPPIGYYQPKDMQIKKQPMFVKMNLQQETNRQIKKVIKTECSSTTSIPKLEFSNIRILNKIPQELFEKAYQTERMSTEHRFRYTPLHFDNEEIEQQEYKINQLRQIYKVMKNSIS